jgi:hypothetical protein
MAPYIETARERETGRLVEWIIVVDRGNVRGERASRQALSDLKARVIREAFDSIGDRYFHHLNVGVGVIVLDDDQHRWNREAEQAAEAAADPRTCDATGQDHAFDYGSTFESGFDARCMFCDIRPSTVDRLTREYIAARPYQSCKLCSYDSRDPREFASHPCDGRNVIDPTAPIEPLFEADESPTVSPALEAYEPWSGGFADNH